MDPLTYSELILNPDGSVFHLALHPDDIADTIILVGDQDRVNAVSSFFDHIEQKKHNREFRTHTGRYKGKRFSVLSTGIGTDNIDIVLNELDALANINLQTRTLLPSTRKLKLVRIGTTGGLQEDIPINSFILTKISCGFDPVLHFYKDRDSVCDMDAEESFKSYTDWSESLPSPYFVASSPELFNKLNDNVIAGITISAPGFYGPQGRSIRLAIADPDLNSKINRFRYKDLRITNYEMESSALFGLSRLLGHEAATICAMIANRISGEITNNYKSVINKLISFTLDRLC